MILLLTLLFSLFCFSFSTVCISCTHENGTYLDLRPGSEYPHCSYTEIDCSDGSVSYGPVGDAISGGCGTSLYIALQSENADGYSINICKDESQSTDLTTYYKSKVSCPEGVSSFRHFTCGCVVFMAGVDSDRILIAEYFNQINETIATPYSFIGLDLDEEKCSGDGEGDTSAASSLTTTLLTSLFTLSVLIGI